MTPQQLDTLEGHIQILDVRLADDFEAAHLSRAINNCVFEVAFSERLKETIPDKAAPTLVYGADDESHEAIAAAEKLRRAGYSDVRILEGGFAAALRAGLEVTSGTPLPPSPSIPTGRIEIDLRESRVEWMGRNLLNRHWGTVAIESGYLEFDGECLTGGEVVIDLTTLECSDLAGTDMHDVLIHHLHSDDFFDVENHPKARLTITEAKPSAESSPGGPNLLISGTLDLHGQNHELEFTAAAGLTPEGKPAAQAAFSIDRTRWGIIYGSGKFFYRLAGHLVNDQIEFQIRIVTV